MLKPFKNYFKEVRECNCDTFNERRTHLQPAFILSLLFFITYYLVVRGSYYGFKGQTFWLEVMTGLIPLVGFIGSIVLSRKITRNEILTFPIFGYYIVSAISLIIPEYYELDKFTYSQMIIVGVFYASFIGSIRCNFILSVLGSIFPFIIAMKTDHLEISIISQGMPIVILITLLGGVFSYRLNVIQKRFRVLKENLNNEKDSLLEAQTVAKMGNWRLQIPTKIYTWSQQMHSIFARKIEDGPPSFENHRSKIHPEDLQIWDSSTNECIQNGTPYKIQFRTFKMEDQDSEVWVELRAQAVLDEDGKVIELFGTCQDITDFKKLEKQLLDEKNKMNQAAKLATLGEMAAGVAHEINNPSAIIQGHASMLLRNKDKADAAFIEKMVNGIEKSVNRITKIVRGLSKFSRITDGDQSTQLNVKNLFTEIINLTQVKAKSSSVQVEMEDVSSDISIFGDEIKLEQVLVNLISNAIDAQAGRENAWVKVKYNENLKFHELIVMDSGHGIPEALIKNLFDPFFTTKDSGKGTGLGLSISKGIAQEHKGDLIYKIIDDHTAFVLSLPKKQKNAKRKSEVA